MTMPMMTMPMTMTKLLLLLTKKMTMRLPLTVCPQSKLSLSLEQCYLQHSSSIVAVPPSWLWLSAEKKEDVVCLIFRQLL